MKVIITGTTGMVGEGVLLECLQNPEVTEVLSVSRNPIGISHRKLKELIIPDFSKLPENDKRLTGYDACFYCAGISSYGKTEEKYRHITYDTTLTFAKALKPNSKLTFIYVSGAGTDSSEKGRSMWARVKGKTENDLFKLPFKQAFGFRVGIMEPIEGQKRVLGYYGYVSWIFPLIRIVLPKIINKMQEVGQAMIYLTQNGYEKNVIKVEDVAILSNRLSKGL